MSAARLSEIFLIFVGAEQSALHTDESVFALSLIRNVVVSMRKGRTDSTLSSLLDYAARGIYLGWSIGTVCFPQGLTTASYLTDGISSTLEPNNILYLSDYQIIHSIIFVI